MNYDSTQDRMDDAVRAEVRASNEHLSAESIEASARGIARSGFPKLAKAFVKALSAPRFRVTEGMLEVLDDYLAGRGQHGTKEEGQAALRQHSSDLTDKQIESCLRRWKKEMKDSGAQFNW